MLKRLSVLTAAAALVLALAACSSTPSSAVPSASPSETQSSAQSTPDAAAQAASVIVSVDGIAILADDGATIGEFEYFASEAEPAVAALTQAFGQEPQLSQHLAKNQVDAIEHVEWPGFTLIDLTAESSFPLATDFRVVVTAAQLGNVTIQTSDGVHVGSPNTEVEPLAFRTWLTTGGGAELANFLLEQKVLDGIDFAEYEPAALAVDVTSSSPDGVVTEIFAPSGNWGD